MMIMSNLAADVRHDGPSPLRPASPSGSAVLDTNVHAHLGQQLRALHGNSAGERAFRGRRGHDLRRGGSSARMCGRHDPEPGGSGKKPSGRTHES
jgi:hypothetical protein